jgi:uronate dehydrogenase
MTSMTKVALSGAGGNVGRILRVELKKRGVDLRSAGGGDPLEPLHQGEDIMHGDLRDPAVVDRLLNGIDVLIHLAGTSVERPLPEIIENNLVGLFQVYEGARRNKVRRVIFASSNHAFGMYSVKDKLKLDAPFRPDGFYGLSKVWGEAMAHMYWDKHGIEGISVRIGTAMGKPPENFRQLSTWSRTTREAIGTTPERRSSASSRSRTARTSPPKSCSSRILSTRSRSSTRADSS